MTDIVGRSMRAGFWCWVLIWMGLFALVAVPTCIVLAALWYGGKAVEHLLATALDEEGERLQEQFGTPKPTETLTFVWIPDADGERWPVGFERPRL